MKKEVRRQNLEYLFEGFLPWGSVVALIGEAGVGKTWLAYGLAKQAIKQGVKVVYLDDNNPLPYIKQMLENFDLLKELKKNLFIISKAKVNLSINKDNTHWRVVKKLLKDVGRCLVIVDTFEAFTQDYDPKEVMSELKEIRDMGHAVLVLETDYQNLNLSSPSL